MLEFGLFGIPYVSGLQLYRTFFIREKAENLRHRYRNVDEGYAISTVDEGMFYKIYRACM